MRKITRPRAKRKGFVRAGEVSLRATFDEIEKIRKRSQKLPGITSKSLIEEGRT